MSNTKPSPEREQAAEIKAAYANRIGKVRNNKDLVPEARRRLIAELHEQQRTELGKLRDLEARRLVEEYQRLDRTIFAGLRLGWKSGPEAAASLRDAVDRAKRARTPSEAAAMLEQAEQCNDATLAAAVAKYAGERGDAEATSAGRDPWHGVLVSYLDRRPHLGQYVERAAEIEQLRERQPFGDPFSSIAPVEVREHERDVALRITQAGGPGAPTTAA